MLGHPFDGRPLHGFWTHLDWELDGRADELRLLLNVRRTLDGALDPQQSLVPVSVILGEGTLADTLERTIDSGRRRAQALDLAPSRTLAARTTWRAMLRRSRHWWRWC